MIGAKLNFNYFILIPLIDSQIDEDLKMRMREKRKR